MQLVVIGARDSFGVYTRHFGTYLGRAAKARGWHRSKAGQTHVVYAESLARKNPSRARKIFEQDKNTRDNRVRDNRPVRNK